MAAADVVLPQAFATPRVPQDLEAFRGLNREADPGGITSVVVEALVWVKSARRLDS